MSRSAAVRKRERRQKEAAAQRQWTMFALIGAIALSLGFVAWAMSSSGPVSSSSGPASDGGIDFQATTLDGDRVSLSAYRGQVVMLNFWATWCPPCRAEMPTIQAAYDAHQQDGFMVLAVNNAESPAQIRPFADAFGLNFPIVLDQSAQLQRSFAIQGYPTSIFVDAAGEIYKTHSGLVTAADLNRYIDEGLARSTNP